MTTPDDNRKSTARLTIEKFLATQTGPSTVSIIRDGTGLDSKQILNALSGMRAAEQLAITRKHPRQGYQLINASKPAKPVKQAAWSNSDKKPCEIRDPQPMPKPRATVIYPPGYRHTIIPAPDRGTYQGPNWSSATARPSGFDHERIASRRGDSYVSRQAATLANQEREKA